MDLPRLVRALHVRDHESDQNVVRRHRAKRDGKVVIVRARNATQRVVEAMSTSSGKQDVIFRTVFFGGLAVRHGNRSNVLVKKVKCAGIGDLDLGKLDTVLTAGAEGHSVHRKLVKFDRHQQVLPYIVALADYQLIVGNTNPKVVVFLPEQVRRLHTGQDLLRLLVSTLDNHGDSVVPAAQNNLIAIRARLLVIFGRQQNARVIDSGGGEGQVEMAVLLGDPLMVVIPVLAVWRW